MQKYRFFSVFIVLFISGNFVAQISLQKFTDEFNNLAENKFGSVSISIMDLDKDSLIAAVNSEKTLMCASIAKLFSTFSALEILGANHRSQTNIYTDGTIDSNGALRGDLIIRGGGDVTLGSKYFNEQDLEYGFMSLWMDQLKTLGILSIEGDIIADGSDFGYAGAPDGWDWSDMGNYYGAGASGINFYDNTVKYYFDTPSNGKKVEFKRTFPEDPKLKFSHTIKSANIRNDQSYLYGAPYSQDRFGIGSLPSNRTEFVVKGSMHDPEYLLAKEFSNFLKNSNFKVSGASLGYRQLNRPKIVYDSLQLLHVHKGESILDIIKLTNEKSINLFAEGMLNLVGFEQNSFGSTKSGIRAIYKNFEGKIDLSGMDLKDGSGLSRKNAISACNFVNLLSYIHRSPLNDTFRGSLAVAGESGTLKNICRSQAASGRMFAKSGTLSNVKAYAGFVNTISGKHLAFAIIVNNFEGPRYQMVKKMERIFNAMASY
jgi:D-alanyl-D-alanine carboxypeptidase/D-alanyl-D-alanine-endopeptidase (penicillin-binding protein 4)